MKKNLITVKSGIQAPIDKVWDFWTQLEHIKSWNNASEDWHTPAAENDFRENGKFCCRMEAKDGSAGFDFEGTYNSIEKQKSITYTLTDGRRVTVNFQPEGNTTFIEETFEAEDTHSLEMQKEGWQAILDNFKKYAENN